ncbi:putative Glutamate receptor-like 89, partial [Homarus americanus]
MNSPSRVVFGTWITAVIALSCAYTGVLISFLTVPKTERAISSLYDLPKQKNYQWTFMKGSAHESLFLGDGAEQIYKTIGAPFLEDMSDLVTTNQKAIDQVLQGTHVYI